MSQLSGSRQRSCQQQGHKRCTIGENLRSFPPNSMIRSAASSYQYSTDQKQQSRSALFAYRVPSRVHPTVPL